MLWKKSLQTCVRNHIIRNRSIMKTGRLMRLEDGYNFISYLFTYSKDLTEISGAFRSSYAKVSGYRCFDSDMRWRFAHLYCNLCDQ